MKWFKNGLAAAAKWFFLGIGVSGIQKVRLRADLDGLTSGKDWILKNLSACKTSYFDKESVLLDKSHGEGLCWIDGFNFPSGEIELEIAASQQPVGIAFHVRDEKNFDAVVFRTEQRDAGLVWIAEYVSRPSMPNSVIQRDVIDDLDSIKDGLFHARLVIDRNKLIVIVNRSNVPCLRVMEIDQRRKTGSVGIWVGKDTAGIFTGLKVKAVIKHVRI